MAFKYKPYKNKYSQESKILDELHSEKISNFITINIEIDKLKKKIFLLNNKLLDKNINYTEFELNDIKKNINKYENKILNIQNSNDELEYYEKTKDVLIQYYNENTGKDNDIPNEIYVNNDMNIQNINNYDNNLIKTYYNKNNATNYILNKNNISYNLTNFNNNNDDNIIDNNDTDNYDNVNDDNVNDDNVNDDNVNDDNVNDDNVNDDNVDVDNNDYDTTNLNAEDDIMIRFNLLNKITNKEKKYKNQMKKKCKTNEKKSILSFLSVDNSGNKIKQESITQIIHEKGTLKDIYLSLTDSYYLCNKIKLSPIKNCKNCNNELTLMQSEGYFVCQNCREAEYVIIESEVPSHKDSMNEKPKYPYNPINHLIEKLNQYQAKQTTIIPIQIYELVKNELKKRMISIDDVSPELIQKILKKYRKDIYYEHHFLIFSYITGTPPPSLTREEEEDIKKMFKMTEKPFKIFKPESRENYLNYSYVLNKLFLIKAELDNNSKMAINAKYFKLLKSRDKLRIQDSIWKPICKYLEWPFYPSF
jgi:hypothetical protein